MKNMFPHLFTPGTIGSCEIKNRLVMPALSTGLCNADGTVSDAYTAFYTTRAKGGAGLIITEFAAVNNTNSRHSPNQIGIWSDNHIPGLASFAETMHEYGAKVFIQLCHPGSQSYIKSDTPLLTPSGVESRVFGNPVRPMTKSEIHAIVRDFAAAALRAQKAGLDGIEISAAHGYLLHEFLSPYTNKRTDEYGGSTMNRCRFVKEILEAVREKVDPDFPIMLRISAEDYLISAGIMEKGMTLSDTVAILNYLIPCGVDAVSVSSGTYDTQNSAWEPVSYPQGWRMYLADTIRQNVPVPVVGVSVIREPEYAEGIIKHGAVDFVGVARGQMADPDWGEKAREGRPREIRRCISCLHCIETYYNTGKSECAINPRSNYETKYTGPVKTGTGRPVVIVGAGPAGMEAARILAIREFKPILFEKSDRLGGQLNIADKPPFKGKIDWIAEYFAERLKVLNVDVRLNTEVTVEAIKAENPVAVLLALGSQPNLPASIVGIDGPNVYRAPDVLTGAVKLRGRQVIVVGDGQTGIETAEFLGTQENVVSIIGRDTIIGKKIYDQNRVNVCNRLRAQHTRFFPNRSLVAINPQGITVENVVTHDLSFMATDAVVLALGVKPATAANAELIKAFPDAVLLGDAIHGGRIADAVRTAFEAANSIE